MSRSSEITHKIMSSIKSKDTRPEKALRKELWKRGLRYRKNVSTLPGKPDLVFIKAKIAVFCDGDFWHGHNWAIRGYGSFEEELKRYSDSWVKKLKNNINRDERNNKKLAEMGWTVIRIWESEIKRDVKKCGDKVEYAYWNKMRQFKKEIDYEQEV
ncbi:MAG: very short patch repair endonuclease [Ruminococcus sp.]|nr:very short patch repair endonuclease [Ruminococcus sp.]